MTLELKQIFPDKSEEEAVKELHSIYLKGASSREIAKALGTTDVTILNYFRKYQMEIKTQGGHYEGKHISIQEDEYLNMTTKELMEKYHCSQFTVYQLTKRFKSRVGREKKYVNNKRRKNNERGRQN